MLLPRPTPASILTTLNRHRRAVLIVFVLLLLASTFVIPGPDRQGAQVSITPASILNQASQSWTAQVAIDSNIPVNSADITIHYNPNLVELRQATNQDSGFDMVVFKPQINASAGTVRFVQTSLTGHQGQTSLGSLSFRGIRQGQLTLTASDLKIIAHDGHGTNVAKPTLHQPLAFWLLNFVGIKL